MSCCLLLGILFVCSGLMAQEKIDVHTRDISMVFTVGASGKLYQSYLGTRVAVNSVPADTAVESYAQGGGSYLFEPAVRIVHADGNPSLDLRVNSWRVDSTTDSNIRVTSIVMKDPVYPVTVVLELRAFYRENVITSSVQISHAEKSPVRVTNFSSSMLHFHADSYWLTQWHGDWAR